MSNNVNDKSIQLLYIDNEYKQTVNNLQNKYSENCLYNNGNSIGNSGCLNEEQHYNYYSQSPFSMNLGPQNFPGGSPIDINVFMQSRGDSNYIVHSKLISQINAGTTQINFIYNDRDDLQSEWNFQVTSGKKLNKIEILEKGICVKKFLFNYESTYSNEITSNANVTEDIRKRFFLTELIESSCNNTIIKPYNFIYNSTKLPNRLSYAQDKWGYYNGKINNLSLFSSFNYFDNPQTYTSDRNVDNVFAKAGILEKIIYPTKGSVNFEYESHLLDTPVDYKYEAIPCGTVASTYGNLISGFQPQPQGQFTSPSNSTSFIYNLNSNQIISMNSILMYPSPLYSLGQFCNNQTSTIAAEIIDSVTGEVMGLISYTNYTSDTKKFFLNPTKFVFGRTYTFKVYGTQCYHSMTTLNIHNILPIFEVGGLRIKKIMHKNFDNFIVKEMRYDYYQPKMITNLKKTAKINFNYLDNLISLNDFISDENINYLNNYCKSQAGYNWDNVTSQITFLSSGKDLFDFNFTGPHITYGKVIETNGLGKTEYNFNEYKNYNELNNFGNITYPSAPKLQSILAGDLMSEITWNENNTDVKTIRNEYNYNYSNVIVKGIRYLSYGNSWQQPGVLLNSYNLQGQIKTQKKETETTNYNNQLIEVIQEYEYNGNQHFQPTKITTTDSKGQQIVTHMYYPSDLLSEPFMSALVLQNRKATPVKVETFKNSEKLSEQKTVFANDLSTGNLLLPKSVYEAKFPNSFPLLPSPVNSQLEKKVTYTYDTSGNLVQYQPENGAVTSIIWGYNNTQPIAKIENMSLAQLGSLVTNLQNTSNTQSELQLQIALNSLRYNSLLNNAMITTYTYKPLIGVSTITDSKGDKITYEYDALNRLKWVKDKDGNILSENQYHYKN